MKNAVRLIALGALLSHAAVPAFAEQEDSTGKKRGDPNEMVCETQGQLGSRLAKKRVCMTRAQWAERRALDRDVVHRTQMTPCATTRSSNCF